MFGLGLHLSGSLGPTHIKVSTSKEAGKAASLAEVRKLKKYIHLNKE